VISRGATALRVAAGLRDYYLAQARLEHPRIHDSRRAAHALGLADGGWNCDKEPSAQQVTSFIRCMHARPPPVRHALPRQKALRPLARPRDLLTPPPLQACHERKLMRKDSRCCPTALLATTTSCSGSRLSASFGLLGDKALPRRARFARAESAWRDGAFQPRAAIQGLADHRAR